MRRPKPEPAAKPDSKPTTERTTTHTPEPVIEPGVEPGTEPTAPDRDRPSDAVADHEAGAGSAAPRATVGGVLRQVWRAGERELLGLTAPPLSDRLREIDWAAESQDAWCPRCGSSAGPAEADPGGGGCPWCRDSRLPWAQFVRLGVYAGTLRRGVLETKFAKVRASGQHLGGLLAGPVLGALANAGVGVHEVVVVPVPVSRRRLMTGGVDHTLAIARGLRRATGIRIVPLLNAKHGPRQVDLPASQRTANVAGRFRVRLGRRGDRMAARLDGVRVVIVLDDIRTTGATLRAACRALREGAGDGREQAGLERTGRERRGSELWAGTSIWAASVLVTDPDRRRAGEAEGAGGGSIEG